MAPRWQLMQPHHLNVPGTEWEYTETSRDGKPIRHKFNVPALLDPRDPADHNYRDVGIIVAHAPSDEGPKDIIFVGEPTPDMMPLNDEARAITKQLEPKWLKTVADIPGVDLADRLMAVFQAQAMNVQQGQAPNGSVTGVSQEAFNALQSQFQELLKQNTALLAALVGSNGAAAIAQPSARRA